MKSGGKQLLINIADYTVECLKDDDFNRAAFVNDLFLELIEALHHLELYEKVKDISDYIPNALILQSDCIFECAFAYGKVDHDRAILLYNEIIKREPHNVAALNNLGVQFEHKGELYKALDLYERAFSLNSTDELYGNNRQRIHTTIRQNAAREINEIANNITLDSLEQIGFNLEIQRKILMVQDEESRK